MGVGTADISTGLVIPDTYQGLPVTSVNSGAFLSNAQVPFAIMGANIVRVGGESFKGCSAMTNFEFNAAITQVNDDVLRFCDSLRVITFKGTTPPVKGNLSNIPFLYRNPYAGTEFTSLQKIRVPAASLTAYQTSDSWKYYATASALSYISWEGF